MQLNFQYPDDIVRSCTKYLLSIPDITAVVGQFPGGAPFIFEEAIGVPMEGISMQFPGNPVTAIVVQSGGSWATPAPQTTELFPKITIEIWADPPRDDKRQVTRPRDARIAADYLFQVIDNYMNFTSSDVVMMNEQPVWKSYRLGNITFLPRINSDDYLILGTVSYGLQTAMFFS
jgi:hypothetical protein